MNRRKFQLRIFFSFLNLVVFGQTIDVLELKNKRHFKERDLFTSDSTLYIKCEVCFDHPRWDDEEYCRRLSFEIVDLVKFNQINFLDLEKDTSIIQSEYHKISVWSSDEKSKISGNIKILSRTDEKIKLDLDIIVTAKQEYVYKGVRTFRKSKGRL